MGGSLLTMVYPLMPQDLGPDDQDWVLQALEQADGAIAVPPAAEETPKSNV